LALGKPRGGESALGHRRDPAGARREGSPGCAGTSVLLSFLITAVSHFILETPSSAGNIQKSHTSYSGANILRGRRIPPNSFLQAGEVAHGRRRQVFRSSKTKQDSCDGWPRRGRATIPTGFRVSCCWIEPGAPRAIPAISGPAARESI